MILGQKVTMAAQRNSLCKFVPNFYHRFMVALGIVKEASRMHWTNLSAFSSDLIAARVALIASCIASPAQRAG